MSEHIIFIIFIPIHRNATLFDTIMTWIVVGVATFDWTEG